MWTPGSEQFTFECYLAASNLDGVQRRLSASIDLTNVYLHILIHPKHQKYLRFAIGHYHYQFQVLPFGLKTSPQVFYKGTGSAHSCSSSVRSEHSTISRRLSDLQLMERQKNRALLLLWDHSFLINVGKSHLVPAQHRIFIGARFRTNLNIVMLPDKSSEDSGACTTRALQLWIGYKFKEN